MEPSDEEVLFHPGHEQSVITVRASARARAQGRRVNSDDARKARCRIVTEQDSLVVIEGRIIEDAHRQKGIRKAAQRKRISGSPLLNVLSTVR